MTSEPHRLQKGTILLDELFEQAPQAIALMRADYKIVRVNREFTRIFGYTSDEAAGRYLGDLIMPPDSRAEMQQVTDMLARGERVEIETVRRRKDGSLFAVSVVHVPLSSPGGEIARYAIYRDITERKKNEDDLRRQKEMLQTIIDNIPVMIRFLGPDGSLLVNRTWEETLGWSGEEVQKHMFGLFDEFYPDPEERRRALNFVNEASGKWADFQVRVREGRVIDATFTNVRLSDGTSIGIGRDITESKQAEARLKATTEQLRALSASVQAAKEEEATRIAREIHDELGGALTGLKWDLEAFNKATPEGATQTNEERRQKIASMIKLIDTTIDSVRRISSELRPSVLDDLGLAEAIKWQARQFQSQTGIVCNCDCDADSSDLSGEQSTALFRIFQETLTNVLRHAQASAIQIQLRQDSGQFVMSISDNGRGITDAERAAKHTLGLLGMRERAHLIGARIEITGADGVGTVVSVTTRRQTPEA
jgi:PAS domain S-box-containing protein